MDISMRLRISNTLKIKGIRPPSNKGKHFTVEHVKKIIESKRKNGSLYHTPERTRKIQESRKRHYDKVGRISPLLDRLKHTKKYKDWRKAIFQRDKYICVKCGYKGNQLQADHILQKAKFIRICNNDFDKCMNYKPLWDIQNGRTLCRKCHKATETYGKSIK